MTTTPNRRPQGTPVGGQFAPSAHPRPGIELDAGDEAEEWDDAGFEASEVAQWRTAGLGVADAERWQDAGLDSDVAYAWRLAGIKYRRDLGRECGMETSPVALDAALKWDAAGIAPDDALRYVDLVPDGSRAGLNEIVAFANNCELVDYMAAKSAAEVQAEINAADLAVWRAERDGDDDALDAAIAERDSILDAHDPLDEFDAATCVWGAGGDASIGVSVDPETHVASGGYYETWDSYEVTPSPIPPVLGRESEADADPGAD